MSRPATRFVCASIGLAALLPLGSASAQQFVDATAARFPNPGPGEWTNQSSIGDLDGDGDLDIVFANGGNFGTPGPDQKVRVYINTPSGKFFDQTDARTGGHAGIYRGVEMGDCDRDGDLDLVLAQDFNRLPNLLINNGNGFFTVEGATRLPNITLSSSRGQFGDVDNDGDLDLYFTSGSTNRFGCGQYRLYRNDGTCHYADVTATNLPIGAVCENMDCIFGDIDNDFDLDIRTGSRGTNNSRLYRNNGAGVFTTVSGVPPDSTTYSYDFGDMDGDGDLDLVGANAGSASTENLLENDGTGAYTDVSSRITPNSGTDDDNDSKFLDFDYDGDLDLLIARLNGGEKLYRNDGVGNFTLTTGLFQQITDSSLDVDVADLDGNGTLDVVTSQGESGSFVNRIYVNNGPADTLPPRIVATEQLADTFDEVGPYVVRALILDDMSSDRNFFDDGVTLTVAVDAGPEQTTPMLHSGGQVYRGAIPGLPGGSSVAYWVTAADFANNVDVGPVRTFEVLSTFVAAGRVGDDLTVRTAAGGEIVLEWGDSCLGSDDDYAVYSGALGNWTSHVPVTCTTQGEETLSFVPDAGDRYYLVVPRNGTREGSYGTRTGSVERPPSASACLPQLLDSCP